MNKKSQKVLTRGAAFVTAATVITLIANAILPLQVITPANFPIATGSRCVEADAVPADGAINFAAQTYTANISGTLEQCKYYDLKNVQYKMIVADCNFCILDHQIIGSDDESKKDGSRSHAIRVGARSKPVTDVTIMNFEVYNSVLENYNGTGSGWGSCDKVELNTKNVTIKNGKIKNCWGEAVGITGANNVLVQDVTIQNAWHAGVYVDTTKGATIRNITAICDDPRFKDNNKYMSLGLAGDEYYPEVPVSKLGEIDMQGSTSYGCGLFAYWGSTPEIANNNGLKDALIANNKCVNCPVALIWIASGERNSNIITAPNEFTTTPVSPTITRTAGTPGTATLTFTPSNTYTVTLSRTITSTVPASSTFTPTMTRTATASIPATFTATKTPTRTNTPIPPSRTNTASPTVSRTPTDIRWGCTVIPDVLINCKVIP